MGVINSVMEQLLVVFFLWILGIPLLLYGSMLLHDVYEKFKYKIFFDVPSLSKS
jgi:hypothetical protein